MRALSMAVVGRCCHALTAASAVVLLLAATARTSPEPTSPPDASNGTINIGTHPPGSAIGAGPDVSLFADTAALRVVVAAGNPGPKGPPEIPPRHQT
jgi:hypothetical protein